MMDEKTERVCKWLKGGKAYPFKVDLFLTHKCNLNCLFCNYPKKKPVKELDEETIMGIARESGKLGVKVMGILGGEPFVRKNVLMDFMAEIKKNGIAGSMVTNGVLIDDKDVKKIIQIKWDLIRFSLDGSTSKVHDFLRGGKSFNKLLSVIKLFNKFKKEINANFPTIEVNTVLCRKNLEDISNILQLVRSLDVKRVYFLPMIEFVKGIDHLKLKQEDSKWILEEIEKVEEISKNLGIHSNLNEIKRDYIFTKSNEIDTLLLGKNDLSRENYIPCFMPWYAMSIDAEGNVTPCGQINTDSKTNIKNSSLEKIWFGNYFTKLRKEMLSKTLSTGCSRCCMPILDENNEIRKNLEARI